MTTIATTGAGFASKTLAHYGTKGMRWGVRKDRTAQEVTVKVAPGRKATASGGKNHKPTPEAMQRVATVQKSKRSTTDSLTNKELQDAVTRMQLERKYNTLTGENMTVGAKFVRFILKQAGDLAAEKVTAGLVDATKK
jgi:hypothetical protein